MDMNRPAIDIREYLEGIEYSQLTGSVKFNINMHHYSTSYIAGRIEGHKINKLKKLLTIGGTE